MSARVGAPGQGSTPRATSRGPDDALASRRLDRIVLGGIASFLILVVLFTLVVTGALNPPGTTSTCPCPQPFASAFGAENPQSVNCTSFLVQLRACLRVGDFTWELGTVYWSDSIGDVRLEVATPNGTLLMNSGTGEFALVNATSVPLAISTVDPGRGLVTSQGWTTYGVAASNPPPEDGFWDHFFIDTGQNRPTAPNDFELIATGGSDYLGQVDIPLP